MEKGKKKKNLNTEVVKLGENSFLFTAEKLLVVVMAKERGEGWKQLGSSADNGAVPSSELTIAESQPWKNENK